MNIDEITSYCKRRGFVFPTADIYGQYAGFYDYGPVGVELANNIKNYWWKSFVQSREDVVGVDGSIITHPKVWEASGHAASFTDPLTTCKKCGKKYRADHVVEDQLKKPADGLSIEELTKLILENKLKCRCGGLYGAVSKINQMFTTNVGPYDDEVAFLRPETAQSIFVNYKPVMDSTRMKPPFGIAQIGKAFRNEISPRNFLFRLREFEQMEIEYFTKKEDVNNCPNYDKIVGYKMMVLDEASQNKGITEAKEMTIGDALRSKVFANKWHAYWTAKFMKWFEKLNINKKNLRIRQHVKDELSHYSSGTVDIEYNYPMGWKEMMGIASRSNYDLTQHEKHSNEKLEYFDEETKKREVLQVPVEPSLGMDRFFLTLLFECLKEEKERLVLKIHPILAPYKVGIFPLIKKKKELTCKAREVFNELNNYFNCFYDESGSIGRRYRRQDEIGTPYCVTIDFDTLKNDTVTIRDRDSMKQERVDTKELKEKISKKLIKP